MKHADKRFKDVQKSFYDVRYSIGSRALNKLSNLLMLSYDKRLFGIVKERFCGAIVHRMLDVGAGQGSDAVLLSEAFPEIVAIDLSKNALLTARALFRLTKNQDKIAVVQADAENLPFKEGAYDAVYSRDVLHHVSNSVLSVKEMKRVTKEKGTIVAIEANALNPQMIVIGLLYFSVDHGVFRNTFSFLWDIFSQADLHSIRITSTECFPRHIFFEYRSPLNRFFLAHSSLTLRLLSTIEDSWQKISVLSKFSNYLIVSASKT